MRRGFGRRTVAAISVGLLTVAACGGGDDAADDDADDESSETTATTTPDTTAAPATTAPPTTAAPDDTPTTTEPPDDDPGVQGARSSVVRIVAEGSFIDPEYGQQINAAGSGTGFIISEDGLAVTNNHVVTGAALLRVHVEGDDEPRNARVLGVSECSDLAVIDIEGEGFAPLEWTDRDVVAGDSIFALGFPLGDTEYTVLDGIVSKEDAGGESSWASVDSVIEHSADTLPGNSGGPIVDERGRVVAVNYAGNDAGQAFAVGLAVARPLVDRLAADEDVDSIGINGQAVISDDGTVSGIWVASTESGSPADLVGMEPGDLLVSLEGLVLATDGTMADYCDILRSRDAGDALAVEVFRPSTGRFLTGTLNVPGDELSADVLPGDDDADDGDAGDPAGDDGAGGADTYGEYVTVTDDSGTITVDLPAEWSDVNGSSWNDPPEPALSAAPDLESFYDTWDVPGVFIGSSRVAAQTHPTVGDYLDSFGTDFSADCAATDSGPYDDGVYVGVYREWSGCGASGTAGFFQATAQAEGADYYVLLEIQTVAPRDFDAGESIIASFIATGDF